MSGLLTLNAGSSSVKFSVWSAGARVLAGQIDGLGPDAQLRIDGATPEPLGITDHSRALQEILLAVGARLPALDITGVGHRIAHGGVDFVAPVDLTEPVLDKLRLLIPFAPLHQPHNLDCVAAARAAFPEARQIGCFDTAFHRAHPWVNDTFAIPRRFYDQGVRRFGFHGLSYDYITGVLRRDYPALAAGRVVIAHLGNGASLCAVRGGASVASTMGFSALDGLPMGTRCGQLDPGVLLYFMDQLGMTPQEITRILYKESGLLGLSGISHDMRTLEASDAQEAAQAIDYFCFRIRREIGAMATTLGGLDALVFCGGIGENSATIRARILDGLAFLGLPDRVPCHVIPTDEEMVIARAFDA
ncbi:MAG: acetate/propionate family kinase [Pseudomonadota bacterium]